MDRIIMLNYSIINCESTSCQAVERGRFDQMLMVVQAVLGSLWTFGTAMVLTLIFGIQSILWFYPLLMAMLFVGISLWAAPGVFMSTGIFVFRKFQSSALVPAWLLYACMAAAFVVLGLVWR